MKSVTWGTMHDNLKNLLEGLSLPSDLMRKKIDRTLSSFTNVSAMA